MKFSLNLVFPFEHFWVLLWSITAMLSTQNFSNASNILGLFPHYGYSHFKVYFPILYGLAESGHNVTVITYIQSPKSRHPNYEELLLTGKETVNAARLENFNPVRSLPVILQEYFDLHYEGQESCKAFYESGFVQEVLNRHKLKPYDLVIMEYFNTDCYVGVPYLLQVPIVGLSSCALMPWLYDRILLPDTPSYVQSEFVGFPELLNWHERFLNFLQSKLNKYLYRYLTNTYDNQIVKKYLNVTIDVDKFVKESTSLIFVNQHYSLSGNRPKSTQLIEIGGIHIDERNIDDPLPSRINRFLQEVPQAGVLFISWGSMLRASSIDATKLKTIISVLEKLPLKIIWKWESDEEPTQNKKFLFTKWAPQLTLLCHPKVKYFWSHGGLLGVTEAVHCGKPLIVTPIYGDQFLNGHAVGNRKIGLVLPYNDIDETYLLNTLRELMEKQYGENAIALSSIFRNRERTPQQSALWWIEHLLRHGKVASAVLHTKAVHLNWFVYHSLDCILMLVCGLIMFMLLLRFTVRIFSRKRTSNQTRIKKQKSKKNK